MAEPLESRSEESEDEPGRASGAAAADPVGLSSLLEYPTKLDTDPDRVGWWFSVYPEAREAGGYFRSSYRRGDWVWDGEDVRDADGERSKIEAARRARGKIRRYCAAHRLNRMGTLTYAVEPDDLRELRGDVGRFFVLLRRKLGGDPLPYLWVPERGEKRGRLHVHFGVGRYVPRGLIKASWPLGFVHIKLLGNLPVGSGPVAEARQVARYLAPYVSKDLGAAGDGLHRYDVAQGFQPKVVKVWGRSADEAIGEASKLLGCEPDVVWSSTTETDWAGPPAGWAQWPG